MRRRKKNARRIPRLLRLEALETRALLHAGTLSGFVYFDADGDGTRDANEGGVPGVVVRLSESNASGQSTITDDNGAYSFGDLEPGTYQLSKRQSPATNDGQDSSSAPGAIASNDSIANIVLGDEQELVENNFGEQGVRSEFLSIAWFFASSPPHQQLLRETIALGEELAGNSALAASIRAGSTDVPDGSNSNPVAANDTYVVARNQVLSVPAASGVLKNDTDLDGNTLTAGLVTGATNGTVMLNNDGSFTYTPNTGFTGTDSFTYQASDGTASSSVATATLNVVTQVDDTNQPFDAVVPGSIDDPGLLGTRMDTQPGAPPFTLEHVTTAVDYSAFTNAPSYGQHHAALAGITPRPTGVYRTEQPDEDLVHNIEHGHVWISYAPTLISNADRDAIEQLVINGGTNTGVIVTPRAKNTSPIVLTSLTRQLTLDTFDAGAIRAFINTNRGHSPEGFIPSGQRSANSETLDDGLPHSP